MKRWLYTIVPRLGRFAIACAGLLFVCGLVPAPAQHAHPPQDVPLHERFYSTWFMPDAPTRSCCSKADCYPTQVKFDRDANQWTAWRREDGKFIPIPWQKVETNRDNPDGRSHICAPAPSLAYPPNTVFCFTLGGGA